MKYTLLLGLIFAAPLVQADMLLNDPGEAYEDEEIQQDSSRDYKGNPADDQKQEEQDRNSDADESKGANGSEEIWKDDEFKVKD